MTWAGAGGATAGQMAEVLHFDLPADQMHAALNAVDALLASRNREENPGPNGEERKVVLTIANALWGQDGYGFMSDFLDTLAVNYGAGMRLVDFEADAEAARVMINDWVSDFTNERIPELIPGGVLSEMTRLVLTNAVYLDATWATPFDPNETWENEFTTLDGRVVAAEVMHRTGDTRYSSGDGWQAVEIPYVGNELAMLVLVPDAGGFAAVEGDLAAIMDAAREGLRPASVALGLPKWEFRTQAGLVPMLQALGMDGCLRSDGRRLRSHDRRTGTVHLGCDPRGLHQGRRGGHRGCGGHCRGHGPAGRPAGGDGGTGDRSPVPVRPSGHRDRTDPVHRQSGRPLFLTIRGLPL